jgi:hypothetical protein
LAKDGGGYVVDLDDTGLGGKIDDEDELEELRFISVVPYWLSPLLVLWRCVPVSLEVACPIVLNR